MYKTTKGVHAVSGSWVTRKEHRDGLESMSDVLEGVDVAALMSLRVAGTLDKGGKGRKEHPAGLKLSETLIQPLGAPLDAEHVPLMSACAASRSDGGPSEDHILAGIDALTTSSGVYQVRGVEGDRVNLERLKSASCNICGRDHDSVGAFLIFPEGEAYGRAYCHAAASK